MFQTWRACILFNIINLLNTILTYVKPFFTVLPKQNSPLADLEQSSKWSAFEWFLGQRQTFGRPKRAFLHFFWQTWYSTIKTATPCCLMIYALVGNILTYKVFPWKASKKKSNWDFPIRGVIFQLKNNIKKCCFKMIYML